jgi:beta-RFAP synthase
MIRVRTASRLHFGLLRLPCANDSPSARQFGGVGLMIDQPRIDIAVAPSSIWQATGPLAERALSSAQTFISNLAKRAGEGANPLPGPTCFSLTIHQTPPEHIGLGVGTQLGMAVACALARSLGLSLTATELAVLVGRGLRSGIGVHGFERGGLLVDGGKKVGGVVAPLIARHPFPEDWRLLLVLPRQDQGWHGDRERGAFQELANRVETEKSCDSLCRLVLLNLLPGLVEHDLPAFGEALYEINRRVGEMFASVQGGVYASSQVAAIVDFLRGHGVQGVGQSSWGPTVFAVVEPDQAPIMARKISLRFPSLETIITQAANHGAWVDEAKP